MRTYRRSRGVGTADVGPGTRIPSSLGRTDGGYTLIEMLVVILIMGLLTAIAIPVFLSQRKQGYDGQSKADLRSLGTVEGTYSIDQAGFLTCSGAAACGTAGALGGYGFRATNGDKLAAVADGTNGVCAVALSLSGKYYVYDSEAGGLANYNATTAPTAANDGLATGACANVSTYPVPAS